MFQRKPKVARLDIVPMIDIMFYLVLFFMVFTTFRTSISGIPLELPSSSQAVVLEEQRVMVTIDRQEKVYYGDEEISLAKLTERLTPLVAVNPNLLVVINADTRVTYGRLIAVMDAITEAGVAQPALAVEKKN
ncbi:ExbD/TolR family protein [Capillibacterium thermochitinicola]|uniref:Biopolymer transporter ExbD n=1 Tax=Capillibacterium thermochitinicola TaxID=2699427 RepID=A0A8J6HRL9_9FIRM|nr:biopolymer transporter ExbD [Capillibacterium thermochitinicola]MBA2132816.1 biopolymer transporter ExbD [Capillibacterium thermochitinicola]